jgi:hypothetical protein
LFFDTLGSFSTMAMACVVVELPFDLFTMTRRALIEPDYSEHRIRREVSIFSGMKPAMKAYKIISLAHEKPKLLCMMMQEVHRLMRRLEQERQKKRTLALKRSAARLRRAKQAMAAERVAGLAAGGLESEEELAVAEEDVEDSDAEEEMYALEDAAE